MTAALLLGLPTAAMLLVKRGRLDYWFLITLPLGQWIAGATVSGVRGSDVVVVSTGVAMIGFLLLAIGEDDFSEVLPAGGAFGWHRLRVPMTAFVLALTAVHFIRAGVPLLSETVETDRFDLAASGFMGIPSRTFLYVLPATAMWGAFAAGRVRTDPCVMALWVTLVVSRLAGGMKSGLLEVGIYAFVVVVRRRGPIDVKDFFRGRGVLAIIMILFSAVAVAQTYGTVQQREDGSIVQYFAERLTVGTIGASAHAVSDMTFDEPPILHDAEHYVRKYASFGDAGYSTGRSIVASYYRQPIADGAAETSVTLGLPVELRLTGGLPLVLGGSITVALLLRWLRHRLMMSTGYEVGLFGLAIVVVARIVGNGGTAFYTINLLGSAVIFLVLVVVSRAMAGAASKQIGRHSSPALR